MINMGNYLADETVKIPFNTYGANGESVTVTNLAVGDVRIYKDGGITQRASTSGITLLLNHDGNTGSHLVFIDTSDNDDPGFYVAGSDYEVSFVGITVATQTLNPFAGIFSIQNRGADNVLLYAGGVWIDSGAANTNTVPGVDGIPSNPVSTLTAARTIADSIGVQKYYITNGSSLTLAATHESWEFVGLDRASILNLGSQDLDNSVFTNLSLAGTQGGTGFIKLDKCTLTSLLALRPWATSCCIAGNITILTGAMLTFDQCFSGVPGATAPILTFTAGVTTVNFRHYSGGLEVKTMTSDHTISYESDGQLIVNADCTSGIIQARGNMTITDNGTTMDITKDAVFNTSQGLLLSNAGIDAIFTRPSTNYDSVLRSLGGAVSKLINRLKNNSVSGKLEIYKADDSTKLGEQTITEDASANPITELNTD